jgi:serine phosphatase RsbU (regulator of sigma subunit)
MGIVMGVSQRIVPSLEFVAGAWVGRRFSLNRPLTVLGRNSECDIVFEPMSVSRKHASIECRDGRYFLTDLGSTRGTYLNQKKIGREPIPLEDGSTIRIAEILMRFRSPILRIRENEDETQSTIFASIDAISSGDSSYPTVKPLEKLRALQKISRQLSSTLELHDVLELTLASLFEIFPRAEQGFVLLQDEKGAELVPQVIRSRTGPIGELSVSKAVLQRVLSKGDAILGKDLRGDFPDSDSVSAGRTYSLMCAPLWDGNHEPTGVIQIDARDGQGGFDQDDLDLLAAVAGQIAAAVQVARMHQALMNQRELEQDLQVARHVMQALLPERPTAVKGYEFWEYYEPARHVGGDYYGYIPLDNNDPDDGGRPRRWAVAVGDVVGKGLPAALLTSKLSSEIRLFLQLESDPAAVVSRLNRHLDPGGILDMYITFLLIILDIESHRMTLVNAGHPAPLIRRGDGNLEVFGRESSSLPLAIQLSSEYRAVETGVGEDDVVILYSDGVTDALDATQERFGEEGRLETTILAAPTAPAEVGEAIMKAVRNHAASQPQFDDVTLICFGRRPEAGSSIGPRR